MSRRTIPGLKPALPALTWEAEGLSPAQYLEGFKEPEFVRLRHEDGGPVSLGPLVDPASPFLAFSHRRRTKAYATAVTADGSDTLVGPTFEIPKDYVGWFEILPSDGNQPECLPSVGAVALTGCRYFLVRSIVAGFKVTESEDGDLDLQEECKFYPGEVLQVDKVCRKVWKTESQTKNKEDVTVADTKFLKCHDLNKTAICLPLVHPGQFSAIGMADSSDPNAVYQIWTILDRCELPVDIRLSYGWAPKVKDAGQFTGRLRVTTSSRPDSLLLYNVTEDGIVLVELPLDNKVKVYKAQGREEYAKCDALRHGVSLCKKRVFPFAISLKPLDLKYVSDDEGDKYMSGPRDMESFSRADVYPPLANDPMPEFWSLSFKDPEFMYETLRIRMQATGESADHMTETALRKMSINGASSASDMVQSRSGISNTGSSRQTSNLREERFILAKKREAQC